MPAGRLDFEVEVPWHVLELSSSGDYVEVEVPHMEPVEVTWAEEISLGADACWVERLGGTWCGEWLSDLERHERHVSMNLVPGRYRICLSGPDGQQPGEFAWLSRSGSINVIEGQDARLHLRAP